MVAENAEKEKWIAFLCYSDSDNDKLCARQLYDRFVNRDIEVWFEDEIIAGDDIIQEIENGLKNSLSTLMLLSKDAITSKLMKTILRLKIFEHSTENNIIVIPITLDETKPEDIDEFLRTVKPIPISQNVSGEEFDELINCLKHQFEKQGLNDKAALLDKLPAGPYPYGLRNPTQEGNFIIPEKTVNEITGDIINGESISLVGAQMMGKTSLLYFLASKRYKKYYKGTFLAPGKNKGYDQRLNVSPLLMKFIYLNIQG